MNRAESSAMSCCHILIQRLHSCSTRNITILFIHVVSTGARIVSKPDSIVFDGQWTLLVNLEYESGDPNKPYLVDRNNFSARLLDFTCLFQEVPETRLGDLRVGCENTHS